MTATAHPVDVLIEEHRVIEGVLAALERHIAALDQEPFPYEFLSEAIDFFRSFADGCHHAKEEELLFPLLEQRGVPREHGPIGCMLKEHVQGRGYVGAMRAQLDDARAGSAEARAALRAAALNYIEMLRQHIYKEDNILFQMAIRALSPEDEATLCRQFADPSNPSLAPQVASRYRALAAKLGQDVAA